MSTLIAAIVGVGSILLANSAGAVARVGESEQRTTPLRQTNSESVAGPINGLSWDPLGTELGTLSNYGSMVTIWSPRLEKIAECDTGVHNAFAGNSSALTSTSIFLIPGELRPGQNTSSLIAIDVRSCTFVTRLPARLPDPSLFKGKFGIGAVYAASTDGALAAATNGARGLQVFVFDMASGHLKAVISSTLPRQQVGSARSIAFSPDRSQLAVGYSEGVVEFYDTQTGEYLRRFIPYPSGDIAAAALVFSPDGTYIATGRAKNVNIGRDNLISADIWRADSGAPVAQLTGLTSSFGQYNETAHVWALSWSSRGDRLAIGDGSSLRVWDGVSTRPQISLSKTFSEGVYSLAFSRDGALAVAAGRRIYIFN